MSAFFQGIRKGKDKPAVLLETFQFENGTEELCEKNNSNGTIGRHKNEETWGRR